MATLRSASGSVFGSVASLAGSVGTAANAVTNSLTIANNYLEQIKVVQEHKQPLVIKREIKRFQQELVMEVSEMNMAKAKFASKSPAHEAAMVAAEAEIAEWSEDSE